MSILVSGASSGLGRFLKETLGGDAYHRAEHSAPQAAYDTIIHCAFDLRRDVSEAEEAAYLDNTLGLTQRLLALPHQRFVYISTVDVYPASDVLHNEEETIDSEQIDGRYGKMKQLAELLVQMQGSHPLILRPTMMLGPYIRPNSLTRILSGECPRLTLSAQSSFNYVCHEDIAAFIGQCLAENISGLYNLAASDNTSLADICKTFEKSAEFGEYTYRTGRIDNQKAAALCPAFTRSSLDNVRRFIASN